MHNMWRSEKINGACRRKCGYLCVCAFVHVPENYFLKTTPECERRFHSTRSLSYCSHAKEIWSNLLEIRSKDILEWIHLPFFHFILVSEMFTCTETQPCSLSCSWIMSTSWLEQSLISSAVRAFISSMATSTGLSSTCFSPTTSTRFFTYGKVLAAGDERAGRPLGSSHTSKSKAVKHLMRCVRVIS